MPTINVPDYGGGAIVNLVGELETRLGGEPPGPPLHAPLAARIPDAEGYVLAVFDGLGSGQIAEAGTDTFLAAHAADLDAPFPATTTVSLASIATGRPPSEHGLIGYQMYLPELEQVVNTIKWTTLWGDPVTYPTGSLLPGPNLWERLTATGIEVSTVQPANFDRSPLTKALYRGCRFEPALSARELAEATLRLAGPRRLVLTYVPHVDFAAHVHGQKSDEYAEAIAIASGIWRSLAAALPPKVGLIGTADHGHIDFPKTSQVAIPRDLHAGRTFYGDGRAMFVRGDGATLAEDLPATWIDFESARSWWGPTSEHSEFAGRAPHGVLLADDDALLLHRFSDRRMVGNHGAMVPSEQRVPLLVRP